MCSKLDFSKYVINITVKKYNPISRNCEEHFTLQIMYQSYMIDNIQLTKIIQIKH